MGALLNAENICYVHAVGSLALNKIAWCNTAINQGKNCTEREKKMNQEKK